MRRPATATVISVIALFFAMSGTAVAATTGTLQLGQSNTAGAVTSLSNTTGSALSLSSTSTTSPLQVSNSVQVPNLNASLLGGHPASDFLTTGGTAANSNGLGGAPASNFIQGSGQSSNGGMISAARADPLNAGDPPRTLLSAPQSDVVVSNTYTSSGGYGSCQLQLYNTSTSNPMTATWWNKDGTAQSLIAPSHSVLLDGTPKTTYVVVVQVDSFFYISTYTLTASYVGGQYCAFTGQVVTNNND